ncbi:hypothetical protein LJC56_08060 [Christensenellaceae bacterium OttesenSCG-928-K19]|nr:hypothetical protein [Christensenellaceae bacterium OttesenSCG-928-K19]
MDIRTSKTKLFLMELIIIILFFSIAGAVCMNLFTQAKLMSVSSTETTNAMLEAQAAAEVVRNTNGDVRTTEWLQGAVEEENGYSVYYDEKWKAQQDSAGAVYRMQVVFSEEGSLVNADIVVSKAEKELFQLTAARYLDN